MSELGPYPAPIDNIATALGLDTMEARDYVLKSYCNLYDHWQREITERRQLDAEIASLKP